MRVRRATLGFGLAVLMALGPAAAQDFGPVTNLPLPRFVSLKASEANVRRGPSLSHRIDWVFQRRGMPLEITGEHGHWRRVRDRDGAGGWIHHSLLSGARTVLVLDEVAAMHARPAPGAPVMAWVERDVVARLDRCEPDWCRVRADGRSGWVSRTALWAVDPPTAGAQLTRVE